MTRLRGQAMVLGYLTLLVLTVLGNSLLSSSLLSSRQAQIKQLQEDVFYLAEGGMEDAAAKFVQAIANFDVDAATPCYPLAVPCNSDPRTAANVLTTTFPSAGATARSVITETPPATELAVTDPDGTPVFIKHYRIRTTVTHPANPTIAKTLDQVVTRRIIFAFQHAVFYSGDLEWQPGLPMTMVGRVHTNKDAYIGTGSIGLLTVDSEYLRTAGALYNKRKHSSAPLVGVVQIKQSGTGTFVAMDGLDSASANWPTESQTRWAGTVRSNVHGVRKLTVPVVGSTTPNGFYAKNAAIKIVNGDVLDQHGNPITGVPAGAVQLKTMYNRRENKTVRMTEIDLSLLPLPSNGLLYATRSDAVATEQPGIRFVNGSALARSLTVVSNDPVYIKGDFNTIAKKPVAVIADALNVLSNNWNDANATGPLSARPATPTSVNAAFVSGIVPTVGSDYSGGLENYPRLHEKWSGVDLWMTGSFVSLWDSQIATGKWVQGGLYYDAPTRHWAYDTSFASGSLPPFTPRVVELTNEAWWEE